jgi:hypothetical protein
MSSKNDKPRRQLQSRAPLLALLALACVSLACPADNRKVEKRVQPIYPELAKRMHISGLVPFRSQWPRMAALRMQKPLTVTRC